MNNFKDLIISTENWLKNPLTGTIEESIQSSNDLLEKIQLAMQAEDSPRKQIGALIGKVKGMQKNLSALEIAAWVSVEDGSLAIGHRPSTKLINDLSIQNTTHVLTLLSENEGAQDINGLVKKSNMGWLWFPMKSAGSPDPERHEELASLFSEMRNILRDHGKIYLHCSAGIHRTGMITFAFLRFIGLSKKEAESKLKALRPTTSEGVGEERMEWSNKVCDELIKLSR